MVPFHTAVKKARVETNGKLEKHTLFEQFLERKSRESQIFVLCFVIPKFNQFLQLSRKNPAKQRFKMHEIVHNVDFNSC